MNTEALRDGARQPTERQSRSEHMGSGKHAGHSMQMGSYWRFAAMVAASTTEDWAAKYLNVYQQDHVFFSWMRLFMAMIMGGVMTAIMMLFMWRMYPNSKANLAVLGVATALFLSGLALARTQATVEDVDWMKAMIPHHSIALLTSERARLENPRVRALAAGIIESQRREIAEMKALIQEIERKSP